MTLLESRFFLSTSKENFTAKVARENILQNLSDSLAHSLVKDDWLNFEGQTSNQKNNILEGAGNRLRKFLWSEVIQGIVGNENGIDLFDIVNSGKILLVNLSDSGNLHYDNARLLGTMLINEIFRVSKMRDMSNPRKLKPFYCYIDEFGQFITHDIARALEECRKFKLFMVLAHQHLAQLKKDDEYLYASVLSNCKNKIAFGLSRDDAEVMSQEVFTGFIGIKEKLVKDEIYQTKIRYQEERRTNFSKTKSTSNASNSSKSKSSGIKDSSTSAKNKGVSQTKEQSMRTSKNQGTRESAGSIESQVHSEGTTESQTQTKGRGATRGISNGQTNTHIAADTQSENRSSSFSLNTSEHTSNSEGRNTGSGVTKLHGSGYGRVTSQDGKNDRHTSDYTSFSRSDTDMSSRASTVSSSRNESHSDSSNSSSSHSQSDAQSISKGEHREESEFESKNKALMNSLSNTQIKSQNKALAQTRDQSEGYALVLKQIENKGGIQTQAQTKEAGLTQTTGQSNTQMQGVTETDTAMFVPYEYQELTSRTFWGLQELEYLAMSEMKNQRSQFAFVKIGAEAPVQVKVNNVKSVFQSPRQLKKFLNSVFRHHKDWYIDLKSMQEQMKERERKLFGDNESTCGSGEHDDHF